MSGFYNQGLSDNPNICLPTFDCIAVSLLHIQVMRMMIHR